jgi:hypothetical protein
MTPRCRSLLDATIARALAALTALVEAALADGGMTEERYARFLAMQYHLTKDVQAYFFTAAANRHVGELKGLRKFLIRFAVEEERHYELALRDYNALRPTADGTTAIPACPFAVDLWHAYFRATVTTRPFLRLGGTAVLENLGDGKIPAVKTLVSTSSCMRPDNTAFLRIHLHEELPHGQEVLAALGAAGLTEDDERDLLEGARRAAELYLSAIGWVLGLSPLAYFDTAHFAAEGLRA